MILDLPLRTTPSRRLFAQMTRAGLLLLPALALAELPCDTPSLAAAWEFAGPAGYVVDGDPTHVASAGAAQAMAPLEGGGWLMATANGGIWRSEDISVASPRWTPALDGQPVACTSISAMEAFEGRVVLAGCGAATSSEMGYDWTVANAGDWGGLMISRDAGATWAMVASFPQGYYVTAVLVADASTFVVAARAAFRDRDDGGVWASRDGGLTWNRTLSRPVYDLAREDVKRIPSYFHRRMGEVSGPRHFRWPRTAATVRASDAPDDVAAAQSAAPAAKGTRHLMAAHQYNAQRVS